MPEQFGFTDNRPRAKYEKWSVVNAGIIEYQRWLRYSKEAQAVIDALGDAVTPEDQQVAYLYPALACVYPPVSLADFVSMSPEDAYKLYELAITQNPQWDFASVMDEKKRLDNQPNGTPN